MDDWEFHDIHGHFHYTGFAQSFLYEMDDSGARVGPPIREGRKVSFCVVDPENTLVESDESNNCGGVYVSLSDMDTDSPQAELLVPAPGC